MALLETTDLVRKDLKGRILWLTLNRAVKANALTVAMSEALAAHIGHAAADESISAVIITGEGEKIFCAGVDVRETGPDGDMSTQRARRSKATAALQDVIIEAEVPIIVALNGSAIGAGAMMALMADACVAVEEATLSLPEIDIGIPTFSGASILAAVSGRALALDLVQSGRRMTSREAASVGLIAQIAEPGRLAEVAQARAEMLSGKPVDTFASNKRWINRPLMNALQEAREKHVRHRSGNKTTEVEANG